MVDVSEQRPPKTLPLVRRAPAGIRTIAALVVVGQTAGAAAALALAIVYGVGWVSIVVFAVMYMVTTLSLTIGFHRYFSHRSFHTSRPVQFAFVILGSMGYQGPLTYWVATHRRHHQFSDIEGDPHSPHLHGGGWRGMWAGFWHSHVGWLFAADITNLARFFPDIIRDAAIFRLQRYYLTWAAIGLAIPALVGAIATGSSYGALEAFLWGGPLRLFCVSNASWAVGSFSHLFGSRPFETHDHSANNFWVALLAFGEGLQNNHHAFPSAARHAFHRWEPDLSGRVIGALERMGIIWDLRKPSPEAVQAKYRRASLPAGQSERELGVP